MDINISTYSAATRVGAAFPGACSAWAGLAATGPKSALSQNSALTAGRPEPRPAAFRHVPAPVMMPLAPLPAELATAVTSNCKQTTNVNETRIDAGGYGAMGPEPEREPAY